MINGLRSYVHELPDAFPLGAFNSAYYSFAISSLVSRSFRAGFNSAILAATATLVGSLCMPLIIRYFGESFSSVRERDHLSWKSITLMKIASLWVMQLILSSLGAYRINLFASAFFTLLAIDLSLDHDGLFHAKKKGPVFIIV